MRCSFRMRRRRALQSSRRRRRIAGGIAGSRRVTRVRADALVSAAIGRAVRSAHRRRQLAPHSSAAICVCRRATGCGADVGSPAHLSSRTRPSGRCCADARDLAAASAGPASRPSRLRVALPRRSAAHGRPAATLRFSRPGHRRDRRSRSAPRCDAPRAHGSATTTHTRSSDHSRLAYVGSPASGSAATGFARRALAFFAEDGIVSKGSMTDTLQLVEPLIAILAAATVISYTAYALPRTNAGTGDDVRRHSAIFRYLRLLDRAADGDELRTGSRPTRRSATVVAAGGHVRGDPRPGVRA